MFTIRKKPYIIYIGLFVILACVYILYYRKTKMEAYLNFQEYNLPTFHVLIASGGRPSLREMLDSLKGELSENDAITVVFDGPEAKNKSGFNKSWMNGHLAKINIIEQDPNLGFWGHPALNKYIPLLKPETTYVMFADDDDEYVSGSFNILRKKCTDPNVLYISKMKYHKSHPLYPSIVPILGTNSFSLGNISTQNGIIPFNSAGKSTFTHIHGGDYDYYKGLKDNIKNIVFLDDIIYIVFKR